MTPSSVTCPHCQTTFRITNAQLKAANGSVRCGSCLQVFNAMDQVEQPKAREEVQETVAIVEKSTTAHRQEEAPVAAKPKQQPGKKLVVHKHQPIKKSPPSRSEKAKKFDPSVKAKVANPAKEYDGYHQQSIETLIRELDERETKETINTQQRRKKRAYRGVAASILILLLVLQFAWFNRHTLSLSPALRPAYAMACHLLSCSLPPLVNINAIRSIDLVVRSHPSQNKALQVDAVIINEASHPQPFPDLELTFTDINGRLVANRTFTPSEYLGGELAGSREMPAAQPIRLGLEIIDPGERAVNYRLTFNANNHLINNRQ